MNVTSPAEVYLLGHRTVTEIMRGTIEVQEKVDGSQFSFILHEGTVYFRSRRQQLIPGQVDMFNAAMDEVIAMQDQLTPGVVYRAECIRKPKHNTLVYDRAPTKFFVLFDIEKAPGTARYYSQEEREAECARLAFEPIRVLYRGPADGITPLAMEEFLKYESQLGGCRIEGYVVKNYDVITTDKKVAMAKVVSEAFKEQHGGDWKKRHPGKKDVTLMLIETYRTDARWRKAIQHLGEEQKLEGEMRDLRHLVPEVQDDVLSECEEEIKQALFARFWPDIKRGLVRGLPEFYAQHLGSES